MKRLLSDLRRQHPHLKVLIVEQFDKRFSLVENHLEITFPKECAKAKQHHNQAIFKL